MLLGVVCAIAHGAALPLLMLYFGELTNGFIFQDISSRIAQNISEIENLTDIDCDSVFNFTVDGTTFVGATITSVIQSFSNSSFPNAECLLGDAFIGQINVYVYAFIGIAVGVLIAATLQIFTFQFAAERQVYKIRVRYYRAIMRQDILWFDSHPTGELVNRLSE